MGVISTVIVIVTHLMVFSMGIVVGLIAAAELQQEKEDIEKEESVEHDWP